MSKPKLKQPTSVFPVTENTVSLPTQRPIAVYYRQSTDAQIGNVSTSMQTIDMVSYLKQRGWAEENIIMIDMDAGISGSTKIDERPGMSKLFELITEGKIGAVACQDEDRLFRDVTQIQVNIFIETCRASQVLVLTPSMVYDFAHETIGQFHARQFRFKSEMAAEYITSVIRGKLHRAKRRVLTEGKWAGAGMPPGYMVDMRKTLPDGSKNESWRKLVPFEPYAEIVREYFQIFLSKAGSINATIRHIHEHGPYYPDPQTCRPPEGFKVVYRIHRYGYGYCPGKSGLIQLLTNVAYLGHWTFKDAIIIWNNHPAIVDEDVFMRAFNYVSEVNLEGNPNPDYQPFSKNARPTLDEKRPVERPLCAGMIVSQYEGKWRNVGTNWVSPQQHYAYILCSNNPIADYVWSKAAPFVDQAVTQLLHAKLQATFDSSVWEETLANFSENYERERKLKIAQLTALERVMENQIANLDVVTNPEMIRRLQARYEETKAEYNRMQAEVVAGDNEAQRMETIYTLKENFASVFETWESIPQDEKRVVLQAFLDHIEASPIEKHGLQLVLCWRDGSTDSIILPRQSTTGVGWFASEVDLLLKMLDAGASQLEIAATFPDRKWEAIRQKLYFLRGTGSYYFDPKPIRDEETYTVYLERTQGDRSPYQAGSGDKWREKELTLLFELLDAGAIKMELAEAFPHRTWNSIRTQITKARGKNLRVAGSMPMTRYETFAQYAIRAGIEINGEDTESDSELLHSFSNKDKKSYLDCVSSPQLSFPDIDKVKPVPFNLATFVFERVSRSRLSL